MPAIKITRSHWPDILRRVDAREPTKKIAAEFGVTPANITIIARKQRAIEAEDRGLPSPTASAAAGEKAENIPVVPAIVAAEDLDATCEANALAASASASETEATGTSGSASSINEEHVSRNRAAAPEAIAPLASRTQTEAEDLFSLAPPIAAAPPSAVEAKARQFQPASEARPLVSDPVSPPPPAPAKAPPPAAPPLPITLSESRSEAKDTGKGRRGPSPPSLSKERGSAPSRPGKALVIKSEDGEETDFPFRSLEDLLSGSKNLLREAARRSDRVDFSIKTVDLADYAEE
ncbi:hypothetical protein [Sabulicella glaciei]|uniref:Uncharacterized protein n=1 Tax=Sabulicella glaciei TaxID=2984948 RepID=A0ABT3NYW9_9PROT|nr:hypothetical protein [Roseococcus sp. MDT2-1-1]MCW8087367.1 hypothetical protein [Roseococcus sp. MDT2-1-1]